MIVKLGTSTIATRFGPFEFSAWYDGHDEIYTIHLGDVSEKENVPFRMHSSCVTSHYFNGTSCDCVDQMDLAQAYIRSVGRGMIVVLMQEAKSNGILATANYDKFSTGTTNSTQVFVKMGFSGDNRDYRSAAFIAKYVNISSVELLSNSPSKKKSLENFGVKVHSTRELVASEREELKSFYEGKRIIEGHNI